MKTNQTFIRANRSEKNGKTYIELLNPMNYSKLVYEMGGHASANGLKQGDDVSVEFELSGEGFKHRLTILDIKKAV